MSVSSKTNTEIMNDYHARMNELDILELATAISDDGFGESTYTFETAAVTATLTHNVHDGDTFVVLTVPNQSTPIARFELVDCVRVGAVNDKRGKYLDFVGQLRVENYSRGGKRAAGFRLHVAPAICLEPYFEQDA